MMSTCVFQTHRFHGQLLRVWCVTAMIFEVEVFLYISIFVLAVVQCCNTKYLCLLLVNDQQNHCLRSFTICSLC